jgi:phage I-like protein
VSELSDVMERITSLEQARKAVPAVRRLDNAAAEFRITPAQRETYGSHALQLSEESADWLLSEIESRPPIAALARKVDESERLDAATRAYMSEQRKEGNKLTYKQALLRVSGTTPTATYSPTANKVAAFKPENPPLEE